MDIASPFNIQPKKILCFQFENAYNVQNLKCSKFRNSISLHTPTIYVFVWCPILETKCVFVCGQMFECIQCLCEYLFVSRVLGKLAGQDIVSLLSPSFSIHSFLPFPFPLTCTLHLRLNLYIHIIVKRTCAGLFVSVCVSCIFVYVFTRVFMYEYTIYVDTNISIWMERLTA